jgi:regulatory protein NPR1
MEPPTSHVTNAFSDSDSASVEEGGADADADVEALRRLSDNLAAAFRSPEDFAFLADARIAVPGGGGGGGDLLVHRCVLSARSPFLRGVFARRAAAAAGGGGEDGGERLELRELLGGGGEEVEVGYEALRLVLDYLYSGRVGDLPKAACLCVDEDCAHVGCHPAVAFMAQVLFAASTFQVAELTNLFQVRLFAAASPFPLPFAMLMSCQFISSLCLLGCVLLIEVGV